MRILLTFICVLALGVMGCSETAGTGGSGGDGGAAGNGGALPLELSDGVWTWVPFDRAECRDGSPAGVTILPRADSPNLLIYLAGGPICFNSATCVRSGAPLVMEEVVDPGPDVFDDRQDNPFRGWSYVYVPHCTDDYHAGNARDVTVEGVSGTQQFVGVGNMALFLERIVPTFSTASHVVLGGCSSGSQGAIANFPQLLRAFGDDVRTTLYIDSGPPVPDSESTGVLAGMISLWGARETMMAECGATCPDETSFFVDHFRWLVDTYSANSVIAMSAYAQDFVERAEMGLREGEWWSHLSSLRTDALQPAPNTGTFYVDGIGHCMAGDGMMYSVAADGVTHAEWLADVIAGNPQHLGSLP